MLTKEDFRQNLRFISLGCQLASFPLHMDLNSGRLQLAQGKLMEYLSWFSFAWYTLHVVYMTLRLPYLLVLGEQIPLLSLLWHFTVAFATTIVVFWHYTAFFRWPGITVTCFNKVFETWECERGVASTESRKSFWRRARTWKRQELLAVAYPYCILGSIGLILTMYCYEQDMTVLIYSSLPKSVKSPAWFVILLLLEANMFIYSLMSVSLIFQLHILFPLKLTRIMKILAKTAHSHCHTTSQVSSIVGQIRCIQLLVSLFNIGHRNVIHCVKLLCIVAATVNGYAAIAHSGENLIFGTMAFCVTVDVIFLYAFVYEKAFAIPDGLQDLKKILKIRLICKSGKTLRMGRKALEMQIDSIPLVGLRVGDFHMLERISTPVFMDYVVRSIVNLLVMLS